MQFKHPEILYFLFLLVIPILVHLFQLRRFKKEYFTNVRFLKELSQQTRKSSTIKKWLLLFTRLFLLSCLVIAFAQPFFTASEADKVSNEMFIILDNSFSMQAKGKKGELMQRAVQDLLEHSPDNLNFSLITNSESFWNTDIKSVQKELQNLQYSAEPFQLDQLLAKVNARKTIFNKDIIVITDAVGLEAKQLKSIHKNDNLYFIVPKAEQKNNVSVDSVYIANTLDNFYELGIKLSAYGEEKNETPIALYNDKKLIAKTIVNFEKTTKNINFTIPKNDFHGWVNIQDKGLTYDNDYFFSISKPEKSNVISIGENEKSSFLSRIYTNDEFNYSNFTLTNLDYNIIDKQDAIVLNELKEIPQALQTTLKSFTQKGGNVIIIPSSESNLNHLNNFLNNFIGIQFQPLINNEKKITKINFNHPLFQSVFEKKIDNFQYPSSNSSYTIKSAYPSILTYDDQSTFLTSVNKGIATVFVFSAPINKSNSNFQNSPLIVPTFYKMAQSNQKTGVNAMVLGANNPFIADATLTKDEIITIKNSDEKFIPSQQILNNKVKMTFIDSPKKSGNYGVYNNEKLLHNISFNYNRTESNLSKVDEAIISDYKTFDEIETVFNTIQTERTDTQIWKWFIIGTILFLILELLIQKIVK